MSRCKDIRKVLLDVAKEEKSHVGVFQTLLLREDKEHA
jgi:rubrerythrin